MALGDNLGQTGPECEYQGVIESSRSLSPVVMNLPTRPFSSIMLTGCHLHMRSTLLEGLSCVHHDQLRCVVASAMQFNAASRIFSVLEALSRNAYANPHVCNRATLAAPAHLDSQSACICHYRQQTQACCSYCRALGAASAVGVASFRALHVCWLGLAHIGSTLWGWMHGLPGVFCCASRWSLRPLLPCCTQGPHLQHGATAQGTRVRPCI